MCAPGEGAECQRRYWRLIRKFEDTCRETDFWAAMHAVQDSHSPGHRDYQVWEGEPKSLWDWLKVVPHGIADASGIGANLAVRDSYWLIKKWQEKCKCKK